MLRSAQNICRYVYVDSVRTYEIPFPYWSKTDISAVLTVNGNDQPLSTDSYTVSEPGDYGILTINSDFVAPAGTSKLTIVRIVSIVQDMDYRNGDPINADNIEESLDALTAMLQQIDEKTSRTVQLPVSEDAQTYVMPGTNERKGKVLGFDENGENFKAYKNPNEAIGEISLASSSMESGAANIIQFTKLSGATFMVPFYNGQKGDKGDTGEQGVKGDTGATGVGISSIIQTTISTEDDGDNVITVTLSNGQTETFTIQNGSKGSQGIQGIQGIQGAKGDKGDKGDRGLQGPQGAQGERGEPFAISKTYPSVAAMNAGYASDGVLFGQFVLIDTGNVEDEDNAKLYVKGSTSYSYIADLSGSPGIKGDQGPQGIQGPKGEKGDKGDKGEQGIQGIQGIQGPKGDEGPTGPQGPEGPQGPTGPTGPQGPKGDMPAIATSIVNDNTQAIAAGAVYSYKTATDSAISSANAAIAGLQSDLSAYLPLTGGTMEGELHFNGGNAVGASKISLGDNGQITDASTATLFGRISGDSSFLYVGGSEYGLKLRGKLARPLYNGSDMALKSDIPTSLPASDVSSWAKASSKPSYSASEVGAVPTTRKVNNKALNSDISLSASDVGASATGHTHDDRYYTETEIDSKVSTLNTAINAKAPKATGTARTITSTYTLPSMSVGQILVFSIYSGNPDEEDNFHDVKLPSGGTYVISNRHTGGRGRTVSGGTVVGDAYNEWSGVVVRIS